MSEYKAGDIVEGNIRVLKNGSGYNIDKGRFSHGPNTFPTGMDTRITHESSQELSNIREQKRRQAVTDALANAQPDFRSDYDGLRLIFDNQLVLATDPDAGRSSTEAAKLILRAGDYMRDDRGKAVTVNVQVNVVPDAMGDEEW